MPALLSALSIFFLRLADVALGTLRIGFLVQGRRTLAGVLSFVESLVWLLAAAQVLTRLDQPLQFVAYAGGYAAGTMIGVSLERWIAIGDIIMRVIAPASTPSAAAALRQAGYVVTQINAEGRDGPVQLTYAVLPRKRGQEALAIVRDANPQAFVSFEGTTPARLTAFPAARQRK